MIAQLRGKLAEKHPNQAIVDCGGVGYDLTIPVSTYTGLPDLGGEVLLRVHTHVREDAIQLFGFLTGEEKSLFEKLIGISGIGPKLGITVLSGMRAEDLRLAIRAGDVPRLTRVPGIGKKTAERMVLELRDKIDIGGDSVAKGLPPAANWSPAEQDVVSALVNLGSPPAAAEAAVRKAAAAGAPSDFEPLFRKALDLLR